MTDNDNKNKPDSSGQPTPKTDLASIDLTSVDSETWSEEFDNGIEITPEKFSEFDFIDALEKMNAEREALFIDADQEQQTEIIPLSEDNLIALAREKGVVELINLFRSAMNRLGYIRSADGTYMHTKSGIALKI
jgi:hypothetical protein